MNISGAQRLLAEMKRRRVFRASAAYGAAAFVFLQVVDLLAEGLGLPESLLTGSTIAALVGLPVVAALSWIFDISDGRIERTRAATSAELAEVMGEARLRRWGAGLLGLGGVGLLIMGVATVSGGAWLLTLRNRDAVFAAGALPRIEQMVQDEAYLEAFQLATQVSATVGADEVRADLWDVMSRKVSIDSEPSGAAVYSRAFGTDEAWTELGNTPLVDVQVPRAILQWRVERDGFVDAEKVASSSRVSALTFVLQAVDSPDSAMTHVAGRAVGLFALAGVRATPSVAVSDFLIDRFEVSNAEYARFVEAGGYERPEFWTEPFHDGDAALTFEQAVSRFRDTTGRPGPATWAFGTFPDGEGQLPVGGVSWYEAGAYAAFVGKQLPSIYHWYLADNDSDLQGIPGFLLALANYEGSAPHAARDARALGAHGAYDMAGNMREWTANASEDGRLALGGAWSDPGYLYLIPSTLDPFDRDPGNGFRTMRLMGDLQDPGVVWGPLPRVPVPDPREIEPVSDDVYRVFTRFFESEALPLEPTIDEVQDSSPHWTRQRISFAAGYGSERVTALLYLPKSARPPYQTIIFMGGAGSFSQRPSDTESQIQSWSDMEYLIRGGRAVLFPLWNGSYERGVDGFSITGASAAALREKTIEWVKELRQSIDYLESRDDIDGAKIGYQGTSNGAVWGPILMALEPRLKTGILLGGGFVAINVEASPIPPEIDAVHYAPRVRVPVLMMNGRYDAIFPYENSQAPMFRALGTPEAQKRHLTYDSGHSSYGWSADLYREGLAWLDGLFGEPAR